MTFNPAVQTEKHMAKKQAALPGMEREVHKGVEERAAVYVKSRDKRVKASENEVADKAALIAEMQKAKINVYKDEDHGLITLHEGKPNVKVAKDDEPEPDDDAKAA